MNFPLPAQFSQFSYEEDKLLISLLLHYNDQTFKDSLIPTFTFAHAQNKVSYPKPPSLLNQDFLLQRIALITSSPLCSAYVDTIIKELELSVNNFQQPLEFQQAVEEQKYGRDKLTVHLNQGKPNAQQFATRKHAICSQSTLLTEKAYSTSLDAAKGEEGQIELTEQDCKCQQVHRPQHFDPELFQSYLLFSRHPFILRDINELKQLKADLLQNVNLRKQQLTNYFYKTCSEDQDNINRWQNQAKLQVEKEIQQKLEDKIEDVTTKYKNYTIEAFSVVQNDYYNKYVLINQQLTQNQYYCDSLKQNKFNKYFENIRVNLTDKIQQKIQIKDLTTTFISASHNKQSKLLDFCAQQIAENIFQFANNFDLQKSEQISPNSISTIVGKLTDEQLEELTKQYNFEDYKQFHCLRENKLLEFVEVVVIPSRKLHSLLPAQLVAKYIQSRVDLEIKKYETMNVDEMQFVNPKHFAEIFQKTVKKAKSRINQNLSNLSQNLSQLKVQTQITFSEMVGYRVTNGILTFTKANLDISATSDPLVQYSRNLKLKFRLQRLEAGQMQIGILVDDQPFLLQNDGILTHHGQQQCTDLYFDVDELIRIEIDSTLKTVSFSKNDSIVSLQQYEKHEKKLKTINNIDYQKLLEQTEIQMKQNAIEEQQMIRVFVKGYSGQNEGAQVWFGVE
ncbi:Conserved_hypothetical protein [Hexamita inflata]|uniref:Uncharacterized protein n=1 Tax=Hexamita inflata TaxID=28002 RepID=A0AA86R5C4_9EUKA|nr:Conserved hypothetical protein [Hexamita inflata]